MSSEPEVSFRKIGSTKRLGMRKRESEKIKSSSSECDQNSLDNDKWSDLILTDKKRKLKRRRNMISTTNKKQKCAVDCSSTSDSDLDQAKSEFDPDLKFVSSCDAALVGPRDMGATARSYIDTEYEKDAQAQFERVQKTLEETAQSSSTEKVYKGLAMYGAKKKFDTVKGNASNGLNRIGPIRATQYMRSSVRWDYAPDVCKDYKETGYCTFGDSCKFMHDRSDYKHGWQLEKEWDEGKFVESKDDEYLISSDEHESEPNLPVACFICRNDFKNPIITKCKHYFCEVCALERCKKTKKCAVCNANTEGQFVIAKEFLKINKNNKAIDEESLEEDKSEN